jgi:hypothetical protein
MGAPSSRPHANPADDFEGPVPNITVPEGPSFYNWPIGTEEKDMQANANQIVDYRIVNCQHARLRQALQFPVTSASPIVKPSSQNPTDTASAKDLLGKASLALINGFLWLIFSCANCLRPIRVR